MIKKTIMAMSLAIAAAVAGGCAHVQVADDFGGQKISESSSKNVAHVYASNWGLYLLSIPLITGSVDKPGAVVFGEDTVNPKSVVKMVTKKSDDLGANKTLDLDTKESSVWIFPLFVFFINEVQTSGNAVK